MYAPTKKVKKLLEMIGLEQFIALLNMVYFSHKTLLLLFLLC